MSAKFVLISSYPKSGNTWTRIVFEKIRRGPAFSMNNLDGSFHGAVMRTLFDLIAPVDSSNLLPDEIEFFFPDVLRQIATESTEPMFVKVHDMVRRTQTGDFLYPLDVVASVVYLVRHPFDVAVSTASHFGISIERAVRFMQDGRTMRNSYTWLPQPLPEYYGNWSQNVQSWLAAPYSVAFARYEDLLANPVAEFHRLALSAGLEAPVETVTRIVETTRFEDLQAEEQQDGFLERPITSSQFFREGRAGTWEGVVSRELCDQLVTDHGAVMERLGYGADGGALPLSLHAGEKSH